MRTTALLRGLSIAIATCPSVSAALTPAAKEIDESATATLKQLYATSPVAKTLAEKARGILVFPRILKAGFMVGAQGGDGALRKAGNTSATTAASRGPTDSRPAPSRSATCSS